MKNLITYIQENLLINESFDSNSLKEFLDIDNDSKYKNKGRWESTYSFRILCKFLRPYPCRKKDILKILSLANWKEEWFLSKNDKKIFNQEELYDILNIPSNANISKATYEDLMGIAEKNSTCIILFVKDLDNAIANIIQGMILDPKHGKDAIEYLRKMQKVQKERQDNYNYNDRLKGTFNMKRANEILKEYNKKASKEQLDLLKKTVKELMKYTKRGKTAKYVSLGYKNSKEYSDDQSFITYKLLTSKDAKDLIYYFDSLEKSSDKQKKYLEEVIKKLKID